MDEYLLLESGDFFLLEHGGRLVLESSGDNWVEQDAAVASWVEQPGGLNNG